MEVGPRTSWHQRTLLCPGGQRASAQRSRARMQKTSPPPSASSTETQSPRTRVRPPNTAHAPATPFAAQSWAMSSSAEAADLDTTTRRAGTFIVGEPGSVRAGAQGVRRAEGEPPAPPHRGQQGRSWRPALVPYTPQISPSADCGSWAKSFYSPTTVVNASPPVCSGPPSTVPSWARRGKETTPRPKRIGTRRPPRAPPAHRPAPPVADPQTPRPANKRVRRTLCSESPSRAHRPGDGRALLLAATPGFDTGHA